MLRYTLSGRHPVRGETRVAVEIRGGSEFIRSSTVQLAKTAADKASNVFAEYTFVSPGVLLLG